MASRHVTSIQSIPTICPSPTGFRVELAIWPGASRSFGIVGPKEGPAIVWNLPKSLLRKSMAPCPVVQFALFGNTQRIPKYPQSTNQFWIFLNHMLDIVGTLLDCHTLYWTGTEPNPPGKLILGALRHALMYLPRPWFHQDQMIAWRPCVARWGLHDLHGQ